MAVAVPTGQDDRPRGQICPDFDLHAGLRLRACRTILCFRLPTSAIREAIRGKPETVQVRLLHSALRFAMHRTDASHVQSASDAFSRRLLWFRVDFLSEDRTSQVVQDLICSLQDVKAKHKT